MIRLLPHRYWTIRVMRNAVRSLCFLCLLPLFGLAQATVALAESNKTEVTMSFVVGFNGYYGSQQWIPVNLTLHNNTQRSLDGDLQLTMDMPMGSGRRAQGMMHWHESLKPQADKPIQIALPGPLIGADAVLHFVVNGQDVVQTKLTGTALGNASLVAVVSDKPQLAQLLTGSSNGPNGAPILPETLSQNTLPVNANLYNELAAVVTTPETLASLRGDQSFALQTWVKLGGVLIVMGTGPIANDWVKNLPLLPGPPQHVSGRGLATFIGDSVTPPKDIVTLAQGVRPNGLIWAGTSNQPLIAATHYGRGNVVQTAFSPIDQNLLAWPSNAALWTSILGNANPKGESALQGLLNQAQALSLASASDALSPLKIPSMQFWAIVFGAYALVIGPVLFYVLRKSKSEPLGWLMLPAISIAITVAIYSFGATQQPSGLLTEGVGVLDLVGDGVAETYGIRAFMSPSVTSAQAVPSQPMLMLPMSEENVRQPGTADVQANGNTSLKFSNIGRWGVKYVYAAGAIQHQGEIDAALWSAFGGLMGTVKNSTPYTLHNVALCWNGRMYEVGDMTPGETVSINQTFPSVAVSAGNLYMSQYGSYNHDITRGIGRPLGNVAEPMLDVKLGKYQVMVIATTTGSSPSLPEIQTTQKIDSNHTLVLVRQMVNVSVYSSLGVSMT